LSTISGITERPTISLGLQPTRRLCSTHTPNGSTRVPSTRRCGRRGVAASGDLAVYRSTYTYIFTKPGTQEATTETGNFLLGYKKQADGKLKLAWTMLSDTPAAAPAAAK
jgi:ketosteroid isomerase-like protein